MTWRNDFSQECNQLRLFTASDVAGAGVGNSASFILMFNMIYAKYIDVKRGTPHDRRGEGEFVALSMAVLHTVIFA
ncbi:hypothetical protein ACKLI6_11235 [Klebsiella quasipneumoniae subsp. similipneumoniae]|uniref:hypothetical protein n=1 Tax=Klebsiella quasipneumoniae TaxID=1463165 RepID=UPI000DE782D2|nr:hypothetical protein [Klebsiella quasipneumoniae]EIY5047502.1 hypothetical protein [Klebsiella quasipneumoniae]ELA0751733.1 hypothetical protein [Klebsiella quasipneumoniae]MBG9415215.1 hypothetical protein [Klebsiella quasipneumoniae]MCJ7325380.1 hypothetical protein [Klebsiella quasipneumoniae]MDH2670142.1 hypothetical protein [Klebsiella quasipneumoniae]